MVLKYLGEKKRAVVSKKLDSFDAKCMEKAQKVVCGKMGPLRYSLYSGEVAQIAGDKWIKLRLPFSNISRYLSVDGNNVFLFW